MYCTTVHHSPPKWYTLLCNSVCNINHVTFGKVMTDHVVVRTCLFSIMYEYGAIPICIFGARWYSTVLSRPFRRHGGTSDVTQSFSLFQGNRESSETYDFIFC